MGNFQMVKRWLQLIDFDGDKWQSLHAHVLKKQDGCSFIDFNINV
jgi:hypothetical protein